jgi:hypothetical protein
LVWALLVLVWALRVLAWEQRELVLVLLVLV